MRTLLLARHLLRGGRGVHPVDANTVDSVRHNSASKVFWAPIMAGFLMAKHSTNTPDLTGTRAHINCMLKALWLSGDEAGDANSPQARSMRTALRQAHPVARLGDKPGVEADQKNCSVLVVVMDYVNFPLGYATKSLGLDFYQT